MNNYELRITNYEFKRILSRFQILSYLFTCFCMSLIPGQIIFAQNSGYEEAVKAYIQSYQAIAVKEMMEYHIPASITLAQGIYESEAGRSRLSTEANNHFGIKCHKDWTGKTFIQDDEEKNECFRKYATPEDSFRDHSIYLSQHERYKSLFNLDIKDYKGWAKGLKACGYATNPKYADHLIKAIEDYQLFQYDVVDFSITNNAGTSADDSIMSKEQNVKYDFFAEGPGKRMVYLNNGLQFIICRKNDNMKNVSNAFKVTERKIRKFNDMKRGAPLVTGQMIYLEPKKRKGSIPQHIVRRGETLYTISQLFGVELNQLYKINNLKVGHPLKQGQKILLR